MKIESNAMPLRPGPHLLFSALIVGVLAYLFWTGSRYPALDEKAMMAGAIQLEDSLSFEAAFAIPESASLLERIFWSTLNWINTNKKGMTFGVLFAAAILTAVGYLKRRSFRSGLANSVLGLVIGAPLGVCVNCAAPIAKGMYSAGLRAETTLSAMIASPTLNVVVLTMTFSILPVYMGLAKIGLSLLVILVIVPLIVRTLPRREIAPEVPLPTGGAIAPIAPIAWNAEELGAPSPAPALSPARAVSARWGAALVEVAATFVRNLAYIIRMTVPLMLLAGLLGATVAQLLPDDLILGLSFSLLALVLIAIVGVFLPVPIAFDVVAAGTLLGLGLNHGYVMALLFTLGTFSVYSFLIVAGSVGLRAAWMLAAAVALIGALGGAGAEAWHRWQSARALELLLGEAAPTQASPPALFMAAEAAGTGPWQVMSPDAARIGITAQPLNPPSPPHTTLFRRSEAQTVGIDKPVEFSMRDMWPPFWEGRSLTAGDIDRDGAVDVVIASTGKGLYFYRGDGRGGFAATGTAGPFADMQVFNAALVDLDNDGWLDLVVATYLGGLWSWRNVDGSFGTEAPRRLPNREDAPLAMALSFADADGNGYVDIAVGNWAAGWYRRIPGEEARNRVLWNEAGRFERVSDLPGLPGETLSILWSDIDGDGDADLLVGNDFDIPDYIYQNDGAGGLEMIDHGSGRIPHTTTTTMAIKTGDLTGDGTPEIYLAQIAGRSSGVSATLKMRDISLYCSGIEDADARATCETNMDIKRWYRSGNSFDPTYAGKCQEMTGRYRDECRAMLVKDLAIQKRDPAICALIPAGQDIPRAYCDLHFKPSRTPSEAEIAPTHPQILRSNVLLVGGPAYADEAETRGLDVGGWSWDTKLEDFDLDGDTDVLIVNGTWVPNEVTPSNLYFRNDGSGHFTEQSGPDGLEDYLMTASAIVLDADGDGDGDVLTHPVNGPLAWFENTGQAPRLAVRLVDRGGGPADGLGAVITLLSEDEGMQTREIQSGGGFMSFDAPEVRFGAVAAHGMRIRWSDGTETVMEGAFEAGQRYTVTRAETPR